jgi:hypothetical protein
MPTAEGGFRQMLVRHNENSIHGRGNVDDGSHSWLDRRQNTGEDVPNA